MWVAHELVAQFFGDLHTDLPVIEPTCGAGAVLHAIPATVPAIGIEIDPELAERARRDTGRPIITGSFDSVEIPRAQAWIGNPPFVTSLYERLLERAHTSLVDDGRLGLLLPASAIGSAARVMRWHERFSIVQHALPRYIFPRIQHPLVFAIFTKRSSGRTLVGFALYPEVASMSGLRASYRRLLERNPRPVWRALVAEALRELGGHGTLQQICAIVETRTVVYTRFWRDTIRRVAGEHFRRVDRGVFALP